ncbi:T-complex protein 11-domain-containing protein [Protomyces lactucae-debilis]|uniref:T-complex protein 11-domain-containing protein n=1 Tax=Protomyces lactucae-debilis TaxID=2754530 RepID=A0A1Y2FHE1_PROLT|nr:T-complex protein 11-domain-containing protein [Protomyces lactucae-debilis]ORY83017.1 T-complex protein 11-domain-containing protein [Protomyces lactucae-debilis]
MDRRASTIEQQQSERDDQHSSTFDQKPVNVPLHDYDATAAALSRLTVVKKESTCTARSLHAASTQTPPQPTAEHYTGSSSRAASPALVGECTYETANCPSPGKRSSAYFDHVLQQDGHMKRMRRESSQQHHPEQNKPACDEQQRHPDASVAGEHAAATAAAIPPKLTRVIAELNAFATLPPLCNLGMTLRPVIKRIPGQRVRALSEPLLPSNHRTLALRHLLRASSEPASRSSKRSRDKVSHHPPISQQTLRELELDEILKNAQLRHDIVHDPNLQFRPNTDGERGAKKRHDSDRYWRSIAKELEKFDRFPREKLSQTRVALMLREVRNILLSLVPQEDKEQVASIFDTDLVLRGLSLGTFSAAAFARSLSCIMKKHCAPMRDDAVDGISAKLAVSSTSTEFVNALRCTFDVLEVMKLDIANHQLRTLRGYLLDTAVEFEQMWFKRKFYSGSLKQDDALQWFSSIHTDTKLDPRANFATGFVAMTQRAVIKADVIPTFTFDHGRLQAMGKDAAEVTDLMIVVLLAKQMLKLPDSAMPALKQDLWALVAAERVALGVSRWQAAIPSLAMYLARRADACVAMALPRDSTLTFAETWLMKQLAPESAIRLMLASRLSLLFSSLVTHALTSQIKNGVHSPCQLSWQTWQACRTEVEGIASRMSAVAVFHWRVHGSFYLNLHGERAIQQLAL